MPIRRRLALWPRLRRFTPLFPVVVNHGSGAPRVECSSARRSARERELLETLESDGPLALLQRLLPRARDGFACLVRVTTAGAEPIASRSLAERSRVALARVAKAIEFAGKRVRPIRPAEFRELGLHDAFTSRDRAKADRLTATRIGRVVLFASLPHEGADPDPWTFLPSLVDRIDEMLSESPDEAAERTSDREPDEPLETAIRLLLSDLLPACGAEQATWFPRARVPGGLVRVGPRRLPGVDRVWQSHEERLVTAGVDAIGPRILRGSELQRLGVDSLLGGGLVVPVGFGDARRGTLCLTSSRPIDRPDAAPRSAACADWIASLLDHASESSPACTTDPEARARELLAFASHEIRTPMNGILGMTGFLEETATTPEQREYLDVLRSSSENLLRLVDDVLDGGDPKAEGGRVSLRPKPTRLSETMRSALRTLGGVAAEKSLDLILDVAPDVPAIVHVDADRLRQVVLNLVGNALKFTAQGEVVVRVTREPVLPADRRESHVRLRFEIRDTGIGIPPDRLEAIFDDYVQAEATTRDRFGGTGLGLGICREIVARMGSELCVRSRVGEGTVFDFVVDLPVDSAKPSEGIDLRCRRVRVDVGSEALRRAIVRPLEAWGATVSTGIGREIADVVVTDKETASTGPPTVRLLRTGETADRATGLLQPFSADDLGRAIEQARPTKCEETGSTRRALIVDDDPVSRRLCREYLRRAGFETEEASDAASGSRRGCEGGWDLIVLDVSLPDRPGDVLAEELRTAGVTCPVIAVTGRTDDACVARLLAAGVDAKLTKPVDPDEFRETMARVLGSADDPSEISDAPFEPVFDPAVDDESVLVELVELFVETAPPTFEELRMAVSRLDADAIEEAAHRLKGAAAAIGGLECESALAVLEGCQRDRATVERAASRVELAFERLWGELGRRFEVVRTAGCTR